MNPCIHRGNQIGTVRSEVSGTKEKHVPIYECAHYGKCTFLRYKIGQAPEKVCLSCNQQPPAPPSHQSAVKAAPPFQRRTCQQIDGLKTICGACSHWDAVLYGCDLLARDCRNAATIQQWRIGDCPLKKWSPTIPLTIGMACRNDEQGVFFTIMALRMYHQLDPGDEILVVDNDPDSEFGKTTRKIVEKHPQARYVPYGKAKGTTAKGGVFEHAFNEHVLVMDCHVMLTPGSIARLREYYASNPQCPDLIQGVALHDSLRVLGTHWEPKWRGGMFGTWATDPRAYHVQAFSEPFEVPMQAMGLFSCTRSAWPGFHKDFRGYVPEEWYFSEKFRRAGGRVLCHPSIRWAHRWHRVNKPKFAFAEDKVWNYLVGYLELGLDTTQVLDYFGEFHPPRSRWERLLEKAEESRSKSAQPVVECAGRVNA